MPNIVKKWMRREYGEFFQDMEACVLVDYQNLSASELTDFRAALAEDDLDMMVLKNSIAELAFEDLERKNINQFLDGPAAIVYGEGEPVQLAKSVVDLREENNNLEILGGMVDHNPLDADRIKEISDLPTRNELLSMLAQAMMAPVNGLANGLNAPVEKLTRGLNELGEDGEETDTDKEAAADAESADEEETAEDEEETAEAEKESEADKEEEETKTEDADDQAEAKEENAEDSEAEAEEKTEETGEEPEENEEAEEETPEDEDEEE